MKKVRGMQDVQSTELEKFNFILERAKQVSHTYGFEELKTPIIEFAPLFERNLGEESDVVTKEIYKFKDKNNEDIALRPEFTAGVVRAFIENNLKSRLFSYGSLFRYERPQKGRYREFSQINFEVFGEGGFLIDVEVISLAYNLLKSFGLEGKFQLEINSLGSKETMQKYKEALIDYFLKHQNSLSELSRERLKKNPLRILDSKEKEDIQIALNAPTINNYYTQEEAESLNKTLNLLTKLNIPFIINYTIVRGLDYYTGIVFEFTSNMLGAKSTILAGGRYDDLVLEMGGKSTPAIGFAGGIERLALLVENALKPKKVLFILPIGEDEFEFSLELTEYFRQNQISTLCIYKGNIGKRIERILKEPYMSFVIVIGKEEVKTGTFKTKNLLKSTEQLLNKEEIVKFINHD